MTWKSTCTIVTLSMVGVSFRCHLYFTSTLWRVCLVGRLFTDNFKMNGYRSYGFYCKPGMHHCSFSRNSRDVLQFRPILRTSWTPSMVSHVFRDHFSFIRGLPGYHHVWYFSLFSVASNCMLFCRASSFLNFFEADRWWFAECLLNILCFWLRFLF